MRRAGYKYVRTRLFYFMNINKLQALIPASFDYKYLDADDVDQTETINLQLRRMSFNASASKSFKQAMENEDSSAIAEILTGLIAVWDIDLNGEAFEPTAANIGALPADFVGQLAECVFKRLFPNPQKLSTSDDTSGPLASSTAA